MLKAKLDSVRKNKKGFSLVELIIVVAIMVALIAVLAPSYIKYVQKSRDSAITTAAEDIYTAIKTYYGDVDTDTSKLCAGDLTIGVVDKRLTLTGSLVTSTTFEWSKFVTFAGIEDGKSMGNSEIAKKITISTNTDGGYTFKMETATKPAATSSGSK